MPLSKVITNVKTPEKFIDVLYFTNQIHMPSEIKRLLKHGGLSFLVLNIDGFARFRHRLDLIGTVIIDADTLDVPQQQKMPRIIESLEREGIGTILLGNRVELPVKSFALAHSQVKSFTLATKMQSLSTDDLWVRISLNLAYRKKNPGIMAKPATAPTKAPATGNSDLTEQLCMTETLVDNIAEQLRLAGLVQRDFLPTQLPNCRQVQWDKIFLPVEWVSGDIYDVVRIDENHIGFYIADVVGHGIPAALLTIFVKQAMIMRATVRNSYHIFSPADVISNLNKRMTTQKFSGYQFVTCCYCLLDTDTLELTYSRAGHPYPIHLRAGSEPKQLQIEGPLLGIFQQAEYVQETVQLQAGDKFLLYSDGTESVIGNFSDKTGFNFTKEFTEIKDLPITEMLSELNKFATNQRVDLSELDDITMVGCQIL